MKVAILYVRGVDTCNIHKSWKWIY